MADALHMQETVIFSLPLLNLTTLSCFPRRRSGCTSGVTHGERRIRWVGEKWSGVWWKVSPPQQMTGSGGSSWAPQRGPGQSLGRKQILAYFEGHRTLLFVPTQ